MFQRVARCTARIWSYSESSPCIIGHCGLKKEAMVCQDNVGEDTEEYHNPHLQRLFFVYVKLFHSEI